MFVPKMGPTLPARTLHSMTSHLREEAQTEYYFNEARVGTPTGTVHAQQRGRSRQQPVAQPGWLNVHIMQSIVQPVVQTDCMSDSVLSVHVAGRRNRLCM
jgi:hypothetical protein